MADRYFFNLSDGRDTIHDDTGVEAPGVNVLRKAASDVVEEFLRDEGIHAERWRYWTLTAVNGLGDTVFAINVEARSELLS